ncbi:MAG: OpgC domain-containing protein [Rhodospirillales bacterium]|nr:OpgC domain-containing protein [Rhodospirillales bacterium]
MERDLRLDFFRGLALFCIFIDHIPGAWLGTFTIQITGLYDAAEVFIFISGYTAGLVYGRILDAEGPLIMTLRTYHRVWQLYVAHVFLFVMFMALVGNMTDATLNPIYVEEFRATDFLKEPGTAIVMALTLRFQPAFMDILPLYIVLLMMLPLFLIGVRGLKWLVLAASFALWLAVQVDKGIAIPTYPDPETKWFFNPFAWQLLFLIGAALGYSRVRGTDGALASKWLFAAAAVIAIGGFLIRINWTLHLFYDPIPSLFAKYFWLSLSKTNMSPFRLVNLLAVVLVVATLVPRQARFLAHRASWPLIVCGRHSLHIFCLGILLAAIGHWIINEFYGEFLLQTVVVVAGIAIMTAVAAFMDWFSGRRSERGRAVPQSSAAGGGS